MGGPMVDLERHMISFVNLQVAMHKVALAVVLIDSTSEIDIANRICLKKKTKVNFAIESYTKYCFGKCGVYFPSPSSPRSSPPFSLLATPPTI